MKPSICATILFTLSFGNAGCEYRPDNQFIMVSGPIHIAAESTVVIKSPELMRTPYYVNILCLQPSVSNRIPNNRSDEFGALSYDGKIFVPQVFLRNSNGIEVALEAGPTQGAGEFCFSPIQQQVPHSLYAAVVIISPSDLHLDKVTWFSGDK